MIIILVKYIVGRLNNDYNGILDKLMIQVINDFYKLRLKIE